MAAHEGATFLAGLKYEQFVFGIIYATFSNYI